MVRAHLLRRPQFSLRNALLLIALFCVICTQFASTGVVRLYGLAFACLGYGVLLGLLNYSPRGWGAFRGKTCAGVLGGLGGALLAVTVVAAIVLLRGLGTDAGIWAALASAGILWLCLATFGGGIVGLCLSRSRRRTATFDRGTVAEAPAILSAATKRCHPFRDERLPAWLGSGLLHLTWLVTTIGLFDFGVGYATRKSHPQPRPQAPVLMSFTNVATPSISTSIAIHAPLVGVDTSKQEEAEAPRRQADERSNGDSALAPAEEVSSPKSPRPPTPSVLMPGNAQTSQELHSPVPQPGSGRTDHRDSGVEEATQDVAAVGILGENFLQNGDFESPRVGFGWTDIGAGGGEFQWQVSKDRVEIKSGFWSGVSERGVIRAKPKRPPGTLHVDPGADQSVDLDFFAVMHQEFATTPGRRYRVSFWYSHNPDGGNLEASAIVRVESSGEVLRRTVRHALKSDLQNMMFRQYVGYFTAGGTTSRIEFHSLQESIFGFVLDDVRVEEVP